MELLDPLVKIKISAVFSALTALACIIIYGCGKDKKPIIFYGYGCQHMPPCGASISQRAISCFMESHL